VVVGEEAKELNQWWLERREPMKLTSSNQGGEETKELNQWQLERRDTNEAD